MDTFAHFPALHWTAQQLTDAVPLRLHQLYAFVAGSAPATGRAANGERAHRHPPAAYAPRPALPPRFRVG